MVGGLGGGLFGYTEVHSIGKALSSHLFIKYVSLIGAFTQFDIPKADIRPV